MSSETNDENDKLDIINMLNFDNNDNDDSELVCKIINDDDHFLTNDNESEIVNNDDVRCFNYCGKHMNVLFIAISRSSTK